MTWIVVGGVAALFVVAGLDALRSAETETSQPRTTQSIENDSTLTTSTTVALEPSVSAEQQIERTGNVWALLFAGGDRRWAAPGTCTYMIPTACERMSCERQRRIGNCTPASWQFRNSFADATVVDIVIRGRQAGARLSNGKIVEFLEVGEAWWIAKVGGNAGRDFCRQAGRC
jgi:hypothetical protein